MDSATETPGPSVASSAVDPTILRGALASRAPSSALLGGLPRELVDLCLLPERKAVSLALKAREQGETFWRVLIAESGSVNLEDICAFAAKKIETTLFETPAQLMGEIVSVPWLPLKTSFERGILLLKSDASGLMRYATTDPFDLSCEDWVRRAAGREVQPHVVLPGVLQECLSRLRREGLDQNDRKTYFVPADVTWDCVEEFIQASDLSKVSIILDAILQYAVEGGASDVHLEPDEGTSMVRLRIDGMLQELCVMSPALHVATISRIKVLSGMDVAERRRPQDGRISALIRKRPIDVRVSSFPTVLGEKLVLRILDEESLRPSLEKLGLRGKNLQLFLDRVSSPNGLVLVSGPTGSGKTTTLYSCLTTLDRERSNIVTIEDPVEYRLKGIQQMQVNDKIGLGFANGLRSVLRQDPDVIMVGECRDAETAELALQASLTGHVVFSTIHANDAAGVISRLLDMGIEPFLISSALSVAIAQRLLRKVCRSCSVLITGDEVRQILYSEGISQQKIDQLGLDLDHHISIRHPTGCKKCRYTGYLGRVPVFEILDISETARELILAPNFNQDALRDLATKEGAQSMLQHGIELIRSGDTTISEVIRVLGEGR